MSDAVGSLYGAPVGQRIRTRHLQQLKDRGEKWAMLTSYDQYTARLFDEAGIPVLLVGDSAANNVFGYETTLPVTTDELIPMARAVVRATSRALVVGDLAFGSYEEGPAQAIRTSVRFMKEAQVHAVKLEGARPLLIEAIVSTGIPVMAHIGFTPQSEHQIGGYRVQGRGEDAKHLIEAAHSCQEAGAFAIVLEMVPAAVAAQITSELGIPTIGIGAGPDCDAQVLVWQDMAGLRVGGGPVPRFVKKYADLATTLSDAAKTYAAEVRDGVFPTQDHSF
ncbi:3-methyl-2-oxobutanoate hydroxymethyltransferase [Catelliglobosispora koreensis]|uniref:3-methyl-2-oxobutanoate hydroxymethyltransferase n=1 Tax=Catelliglobosispora koreensis TaxID=129052 RepID=UPI00037E7A89|nr:3-methyl-2-oxobutanoate hydroxymethyltransferase [Catelliglobosispora koreensis]